MRLDQLVFSRGLVSSLDKARRFIMAGQVRVNGQVRDKVGTQVDTEACVQVQPSQRYVSRGALKLAGALDAFGLDPAGWTAADVGASTGGFTDLLLQRGAARVYAVDVGYGQLHWKLRQDPRVVVMERTNARYVERLEEPVRLVTVDASFISLELLFPAVRGWLAADGHVVALIKPQFEAPQEDVGPGGVVRVIETHREVLWRVVQYATGHGWCVRGLARSPLRGPKGNVEFFVWLNVSQGEPDAVQSETVERVLQDNT